MEHLLDNVAHYMYNEAQEELHMNKTFSMSIRVSEEELERLKKAAKIEEYASYSEFIRRTALKQANEIIAEDIRKEREQNG